MNPPDGLSVEEQAAFFRYRVQQDPNDPVAHFNLGLASVRSRNLGTAIVAFERVTELRPQDAQAHYLLGLNLSVPGRVEEARLALQRAISLQPDYDQARRALACLENADPSTGYQVGRSSHHYEFAHVSLREFVFSNTSDLLGARASGRTRQVLTGIWEAVGQERIAQGLTVESAAGLEAQFTTSNGCPCLLVTMSSPAAKLQCFFVAIVFLGKESADGPCDEDESRVGYFTLELGYDEKSNTSCTYVGRWYPDGSRHNYGLGPEAESKAFLSAINEILVQATFQATLEATVTKLAQEQNLPPVEAAITVGNFLAEKGRVVEAGLAFRRAWESDALASYNLGAALTQQGRSAEAAVAYRKAIELQPNFVEAYYDLGSTLRNTGKFSAAVDAYRSVIALRPEFAGAYRNLGGAYRKMGEFEKAVQAHRKGIELGLDDARTYFELGIALRANQQLAEAIQAYGEALAREPNEGAYLNLGIALNESGRKEEAVAAYERVLEINPGSSDAHYNLGLVFAGRGERAKAIEAFERALYANPANADAKHMLDSLMLEHRQRKAKL